MKGRAWVPEYAHRTDRMNASEAQEVLKLVGRSDIISFAGGVPNPTLFPADVIRSAYARVLGDSRSCAAALQYVVTEGWLPLREKIAWKLSAQGIRCDPDNVLVTHGAQQAIELCAKLFVNPGSAIVVQSPTYLSAMSAFDPYGPVYQALPQPPAVPERGGSTSAALVYVMSAFQNPTGHTMSESERLAILDYAEQVGAPIVEDDPYRELHFTPSAPQSITATELNGRHIDHGRCLYVGSFSKTLAPGLRVGWVAGRREVIERLTLLKQAADLQVSTINQMVVCHALDALPPDRLDEVRAFYRSQRDAMLDALDSSMRGQAVWSQPQGGLFVWVEVNKSLNTSDLRAQALARGVAYVPGASFFPERTGTSTLRLSYSLASPAAIQEGVRRLAAVLRAG